MTDYLPKILIVDDRPANLLAMKKLLAKSQAELFTASSGNEALNRIIDNDFALILLDVQMPDMDGFETAEIMRSSDYAAATPIIFVTAISKEQQHVFQGYETGAVDYMFKPVEPKILQSKVSVFLELDRQKKELEMVGEELRHEIEQRIQAEQEKDTLIVDLKAALAEVKTLWGILPLCTFCKKIRDDKGHWEQVDVYIHKHSEADISHSVCPDCMKKYYPKEYKTMYPKKD